MALQLDHSIFHNLLARGLVSPALSRQMPAQTSLQGRDSDCFETKLSDLSVSALMAFRASWCIVPPSPLSEYARSGSPVS